MDEEHKVNDAVNRAREADYMEAKSIVVVTPPGGHAATCSQAGW
jgi:hypothetical protein